MDIQFCKMNNHQRFADCSLWPHYLSKHNKCSREKLLATDQTFFTIGEDQVLYIPLHLTNYFMLIVVSFNHATIEVYDSQDFDHKNEVDKIMACLQTAYTDEDIKGGILFNHNHGLSCAYFMCWYACIHAINGEIPEFTDDITISDILRGILISLLDRKSYDKLLYVY
jgi:hypothetical protein